MIVIGSAQNNEPEELSLISRNIWIDSWYANSTSWPPWSGTCRRRINESLFLRVQSLWKSNCFVSNEKHMYNFVSTTAARVSILRLWRKSIKRLITEMNVALDERFALVYFRRFPNWWFDLIEFNTASKRVFKRHDGIKPIVSSVDDVDKRYGWTELIVKPPWRATCTRNRDEKTDPREHTHFHCERVVFAAYNNNRIAFGSAIREWKIAVKIIYVRKNTSESVVNFDCISSWSKRDSTEWPRGKEIMAIVFSFPII